MRKVLLLLFAVAMLSVGCSKIEDDDCQHEVYFINVPLTGSYWVAVPVIQGDDVVSTDGYVQWELESGSLITRYRGDVTTMASGPNEMAIYYSNHKITLVFHGDREWLEHIRKHDPEECKGSATLKKENQIGQWASVKELPYVVDKSGILMPEDYIYNSSLLPVHKDGESHFLTAVRYWSEDEIRDLVLAYLAANPGGEIKWMDVDGHFMAHNDVVGVGYKKITVNKYVLYISSVDMFDYILLNVQKVLVNG